VSFSNSGDPGFIVIVLYSIIYRDIPKFYIHKQKLHKPPFKN